MLRHKDTEMIAYEERSLLYTQIPRNMKRDRPQKGPTWGSTRVSQGQREQRESVTRAFMMVSTGRRL